MPSKQNNNKQRIKGMKKQNKALFAAVHRDDRNTEIEEHNGKPFTSHNTPELKNKYNRKKMKKVSREDYE
ncbi:MAG: hypothetical protein J6039_02815 [Alphaproteobacteria bacterium]|nr:hypothetical protein [Alphaproteobacteria bacterium]